jgi:nucleoside-diphosphate-sugar epimerase
MMRVLITGAGGFIGQHLASSLSQAGASVSGTFHTASKGLAHANWLTGLYQMSLDDPQLCIDWSAFDVVVHGAFDLRKGQSNTNYKGTIRLVEAAKRSGVTRQIFISSYSARSDAISEYGQVKYRLERYFIDAGYEIIRPGLVLGNGGIVARITRALKVLPIIPLPSGGAGEIPYISIDVLCKAIGQILDHPGNKEHNLFSRHFTSLRLLVQTIREVVWRSRDAIIFPIPATLMLHGLQLVEILRLPIPVTTDNLKGFIQNQARLHESTLEGLGIRSETLSEAVEAAHIA